MAKLKRVSGFYTQGKPGPLLICIGGMHGNEWAGIKALDLVMKMIEVEPITNTEFQFFGKIVCLMGNIAALKNDQRYMDQDLNRLWTKEFLDQKSIPENGPAEWNELIRLKKTIDKEIRLWKGDQIYILDLHTTTAAGGIFSLPAGNHESQVVAESLLAPVILGLVDRLPGTLLKYYVNEHPDNRISGVVFEGGQHHDPLSVNRCIAAVINYIRTIGSVRPEHIVNQHDQILRTYSDGLPSVARFLYNHHLVKGDGFTMLPGFRNFHPVKKNQLLANDRSGEIRALADGLILMPHYQKQGEDGFFMVEEVSSVVKI